MIAFELSMPGVASWNGRWSGEGNRYVRVRSLGRSKDAGAREAEIAAKGSYGYAFGDGWYARVDVLLVDAAEARKLRRESQGFAGYDWMIDSIIEHGKIQAGEPIRLCQVAGCEQEALEEPVARGAVDGEEQDLFACPEHRKWLQSGSAESVSVSS